ncbi:MAG: hypothetical protein ABIP13_06395 [Tepidiformaceae bacterium]
MAPAGERVAERLTGASPKRFRPGEILRRVDGITPLLASWDSATKPSQQRLKAYLDTLQGGLGLENHADSGLYIDLVVDVGLAARLSRHYDLENYLTPVAHRLGWGRFVFARAVKRVGGGSSITIGVAAEDPAPLPERWTSLAFKAGAGASHSAWKQGIRAALMAANVVQMGPGPVAVGLAWRCAPAKNWVALWKPTGDAMGPVLGEPDPHNCFNVADDRIVELLLHRDVDSSMGQDIDVGMAWRSTDSSGT